MDVHCLICLIACVLCQVEILSLHFVDILSYAYERMSTKCKDRQKANSKFERLLANGRSKGNVSDIVERWVVNRSSRELTTDEKVVLRKGLNFAPAPRKVPVTEIVAAVEDGLRKVRGVEKAKARIDIVGVLKRAKPPQPNMSPAEYRLLNGLRRDTSIIILPADNYYSDGQRGI